MTPLTCTHREIKKFEGDNDPDEVYVTSCKMLLLMRWEKYIPYQLKEYP